MSIPGSDLNGMRMDLENLATGPRARGLQVVWAGSPRQVVMALSRSRDHAIMHLFGTRNPVALAHVWALGWVADEDRDTALSAADVLLGGGEPWN
jgi:hypothetical protein